MMNMGWLENKLKWTGSYRNKKGDELLIGNISVGEADPVGIFKHLEKAGYVKPKATLPTLKLRDMNWRAMTGHPFRHDIWDRKVSEVTGTQMRDMVKEAGIPSSPRGVNGPNTLGARLLSCA